MVKHSFSQQPSALPLFEGTQTIDEFCKKLIQLSGVLPQKDPLRWCRSVNPVENTNAVLGEGFELFSELFVLLLGANPKVGLADYLPVESDDRGVDAYAKNSKMKKSSVQCKFRADPSYKFTANDSNITNFLIESRFNDVDFGPEEDPKRLFLITTSAGLHEITAKNWHYRVKVINRKIISDLVDDNAIFWNACAAKIKESQDVRVSNQLSK